MTDEVANATAQAAADTNGAAPQPEQNGAELNISDLVNIKSVIDVASQRGAFRANELEAVGKVYNKLDKFLEAVSKKEQAQ